MHILFAFLTAAAVMTGALTAIDNRSDEQNEALASWSFFMNRLKTNVTNDESNTAAPTVAKEPVVVPERDSFTMEWDIPSERVDGSSISTAEIDGYELSYVEPELGINETVFVDDPSQTIHEFQSLEPGNYLIAIAAIDIEGVRSPSSAAIEVIVQ